MRGSLSRPPRRLVRGEPADGGRFRLAVRTEDGERQFEGSHLLSAIGRVPNTEALTPEAAGIRLNDHRFIEVDEYLETSVPGVYAMGDVKGGPAFTHLSYDDYRILHANLIEHEKASTRDRVIPYTMFIGPQLGRVGLTEREARAQGRAIRVAKLPMSAVPRAIETGETHGFMKAIVDADCGEILGCAVLGSEGGEIMTMIQVAMLGKLSYTARQKRSSRTRSWPKASTPSSRCSMPEPTCCPAASGIRGSFLLPSAGSSQVRPSW